MSFMLIGLLACVAADSKKLNDLTGVIAITTPIPTITPAPETARLKIFTQSGTTSVGTTALTVGDTFQLRAVLVDSTGSIISEVDATWSVTGTLGASNLAATSGDPGPRATYTAAGVFTGTIQAVIDSAEFGNFSQYNIVQSSASTGTITVSMALTPDQILIVSGNNQTGQVGTNLASQLKVRVINAASTVVPGVSVTFAVIAGGGTIISAQPVVTDASGEALCTVKLGGQIGASGQTFSATMSSGSVTQVNFSATGTPGAANKLSFYQQPAIANVGAAFSTQPYVEIQDSYGNRVTSATNSVTLARSAGTGTLTGTVTLAAVSGLASFTNVGYDTSETGVTILATSAGLTSATSSSFDVGSVTALAQCLVNDASWTTTEGGCKNISTGLIWSARSAGTYNWYQSVWRFGDAGSSAPEAWEVAKGITSDINGATTDLNGTAYCHDLTESGMTDWRMPTYNELNLIYTTYTPTTYLQQNNAVLWAADSTYGGNLAGPGGSWGAGYTNANPYYTRCVRRSAPTKLIITTQPAAATKGFGVHIPFETAMVVKVADATNSVDTTANTTITLSHNGTGQFCWTNRTTGVTSGCGSTISLAATAGVATFTTLTYSTAGSIQINASATGLTGVTSSAITINATYPYANCITVGGTWINGANGGCKSLVTGRIYSMQSSSTMIWHDAVWDQNAAGNGGSADADDNGITNDYSNSSGAGTYPDASPADYCHDLKESAQSDWKMIDYYDLSQITAQSPTTYLRAWNGAPGSYYFWTGYTYSTDSIAYMFYPNNITFYTVYAKLTNSFNAVCVRSDPPSQLVFVQQPAGHPTYGLGAGIPFYYPAIVEVRDADGAPLTGLWRYNNPQVYPSVTLTKIGGTGNLWIGNTNYGTSVTVAVGLNGRADFTGLWYDKPSETIQLRASLVNMVWKGSAPTVPTVDSNNIVIPAIYGGTQCNAVANWSSQFGGCGDTLAGGLVWSHTFAAGLTWYQAMWDSAWPGENAVDGNDGAATDSYDPLYPPGTNPVNTVSNTDCHSLNLNGYTDWRVPTYNEINTAMVSTNRGGYLAVKNLAGYVYFWSGATVQATQANAYMFNITTGQWYGGYTKTYAYPSTICVRPSTP